VSSTAPSARRVKTTPCSPGPTPDSIAHGGALVPPVRHHQILIVGGGAAGITVAAQLLRQDAGLDVAVVEPSAEHDYQPGWTLVVGWPG